MKNRRRFQRSLNGVGIWGAGERYKLENIPAPHVPFWPWRGHRREVKWRISTFKGAVGWAIHYFPRLREQDNGVWDTRERAFVRPSGHTKYDGRVLEPRVVKFTTYARAQRWIDRVYRTVFSDKTHRLIHETREVEGLDGLRRHREGD